jgi:hypothetical protein
MNSCLWFYPKFDTFIPIIGILILKIKQMEMSNTIPTYLKPKDLQSIIELVDNYYEGNVLLLAQWLDRAIYLLHFVPFDEGFSQLQKQNTCEALFGLKQSLLEAHFQQNGWSYKSTE